MKLLDHKMHGQFLSGHSGPPDPKNIATYKVSLKDKKQIAKGTFVFIFEKPKGFQYKAGQHVRMTLINPAETDNEGNSRFFSLASTPQEKDLAIAMRMRDTAFKRVLKRMQVGEKVKIQMRLDNPHGSFTLHEDSTKPAVFVVGGIGIVPAFSMIKDATERKLSHKLVLFYSNRRPEDAPFLKELQILEKQNPNLKMIAAMTKPEKSWNGLTRKIDIPLIKKHVKDLQTPVYYISGLSDMVSAMKALIIGVGVNEDSIHAEEFTGFNLNELHGRMGQGSNHNPSRSHILTVSIGFLILAIVLGHVFAGGFFAKSGLTSTILKSPMFYLMLIVMFLVVPFKFKHLLGLIHKFKNSEGK